MTLRVGISCYPSIGGSGIVATEIGNALAARGHRVCFITSDKPWRFDAGRDNPSFHPVQARQYALFRHDIYVLALASKMAAVAQAESLDVLHAHYAVPHATAAYLCKQILGPGAKTKVVTTLHGTDITLIGSDPSLLPVTKFSVEASDAVTAVSQYLRRATIEAFGLGDKTIEVIPNFVDTDLYKPSAARKPIIVHHSNFRGLKRVDDVVRVFEKVRAVRRAKLVLIGDGPERPKIEDMVRAAGLDNDVRFLGEQLDFAAVLSSASVALFPSEMESFGLAALETMSAGVPVVATKVGGLPEVVADGGVLCDVGDIEAMTHAVLRLLDDVEERDRLAGNARRIAVEVFPKERVIDHYEALYSRVSEA
jgi:L-malate glycosyltransferase